MNAKCFAVKLCEVTRFGRLSITTNYVVGIVALK